MNYLAGLFVLLSTTLSAQFGVSAYYQNLVADEWETAIRDLNLGKEDVSLVREGFRIGVDYWLKPLEDTRIILTPELSYSRSEETSLSTVDEFALVDRAYRYQSIGFSLPINTYLFDLEGDCDCPTWSKSEPFFKKGFFLQVAPGVYYNRYEAIASSNGATVGFESNDVNFGLALGAGLDIGFSDLITLSPTARYVHHFNKTWGNLTENFSQPDPTPLQQADPSGWEVGFRLGIRLDY